MKLEGRLNLKSKLWNKHLQYFRNKQTLSNVNDRPLTTGSQMSLLLPPYTSFHIDSSDFLELKSSRNVIGSGSCGTQNFPLNPGSQLL